MFLLNRGFFFFVFALCWCYSRFLIAFCLFGLDFQWFCCEFKKFFSSLLHFIVKILNASLALKDRQNIGFVVCMLLHSSLLFCSIFFPIFLKFKWICLNSSDRLRWSHLLVFRRDGAQWNFELFISQRWFRDLFFSIKEKKAQILEIIRLESAWM